MKRIIYFVLLIFIISIFACGKKQYTHDISNYVMGHTKGKIYPSEDIEIRFKSPIVSDNLIDSVEQRLKYDFSPGITGKFIWVSTGLLQFKPKNKLSYDTDYSVEIDISPLFPDSLKIKPLTFKFTTYKQDIIKFNNEISFASDDDKIAFIEGEIEFNLPVEEELLRKNSGLEVNSSPHKLYWQKLSATEFSFKSDSIIRPEKDTKISFLLKKDGLELEEDFTDEFTLYSKYRMAVILIKRTHKAKNPGIEVQFSGNLKQDQDIRSYFIVEPHKKLNIKKFKNKAIINSDFQYGKEYKLTIKKGIKNLAGFKTKKDSVKQISFNDEAPNIVFCNSGCFLPTAKNKKIEFKTINAKFVRIEITKIFANNLYYFLQRNNLISNKTQRSNWRDENRFGKTIYKDKIKISDKKNTWLVNQLDLDKIIPQESKAIYLLNMRIKKEDALYKGVSTPGMSYYSDPNRNGYYRRNGRICKPIILNNLSLTAKKYNDGLRIYATDVMTTDPIKDCRIRIKSYQNQIIGEKFTDEEGKVDFLGNNSENVKFVEAKYQNMYSIITTSDMQWNVSNFAVDGVTDVNQSKAFIYTERGVYRPGDEINLSMILRNDESFPDNHPVKITVRDPRNNRYLQQIISDGVNGFYNFSFQTKATDPTGNWRVKIEPNASKAFHHTVKIETVVAERLDINLKTDKQVVNSDDETVGMDLSVKYLFGAPAADLNAKVDCELISYAKNFDEPPLKNYTFYNSLIDYEKNKFNLFDNKLNKDGKAEFVWDLPEFNNIPSALMAKFDIQVNEKGGRSSRQEDYLPVNPYSCYVGQEKLNKRHYQTNKPIKLGLVVVNPEGNMLSNKKIILKIYQNRRYWWWSLSRRRNKNQFISNVETEQITQETLYSKNKPIFYEFTPEQRGQYLVEVTNTEGGKTHHTSSQFFYCSRWYHDNDKMENAGVLSLKTDQESYSPGETARINFSTPPNSKMLVSIEKGNRLLDSYWKNTNKNSTVEIPITKEMQPNIYCTISIIQPYNQTDNDRPLRMYGITPIKVVEKDTKQKITIDTPETLQPNKKFKCKINIDEESYFTIAVVDEGLLSITDFQTPKPWKKFNQKQRLEVETYDNYNFIIGKGKYDIFKTFSVGGGIFNEQAYRQKQTAFQKAKRFKPVCLFKGPLSTDENGYSEVEFTMPEYMGSVRIMVVSAKNNHYGHAEKTVEVKDDIVLLPTLPRMLAPGDIFEIPVEIFTTVDNVGKIQINLKTDEFLEILGSEEKSINMLKQERKSIHFRVQVKERIGTTRIKLIAQSSDEKTESNVEIGIRPLSPRISETISKTCQPGEEISFQIPQKGVIGSNELILSLNKLTKADIGKRIRWLIRYPYGSVESVVSQVFPQLFLSDYIASKKYPEAKITNNINVAIKKLSKYQTPSGGFTFWPHENYHDVSNWCSSYAGHFLLNAKELGYYVPDYLFNKWKNYESKQIKKFNYSSHKNYKYNKYLKQIYRLYLLCHTDENPTAELNYIRENLLAELNDLERWLLAASYKIVGYDEAAEVIKRTAGVIVKDYTKMKSKSGSSNTFGSTSRNKAMILLAMLHFDEEKRARKLYIDLAERISQKRWYSTQTTGFVLLALGKYLDKYAVEDLAEKKIFAEIVYPNNRKEKITFEKFVNNKIIKDANIENLKIKILPKTDLKKVYTNLYWSGIPIISDEETTHKGLITHVLWKSSEDDSIDPTNLKQGTVFKQEFEIRNVSTKNLDRIALVQVLPSGWEIINDRLNQENQNSKNRRSRSRKTRGRYSKIDYKDIRDDRAMWFFDLRKNGSIHLELQLRAVTVGEFYQPATKCEVMYDNRYKSIIKGQKVKIFSE